MTALPASLLRDTASRPPERFGSAVPGTGRTLAERQANRTALLAALNSGEVIDGGGRTYEVAGGEIAPAVLRALRNITIKQTEGTGLATLRVPAVDSPFLDRVTIDMGNFRTTGTMQNTFGVRAEGATNFVGQHVHVINGGPHTGILMRGCTMSSLIRPMIETFNWTLSGANNDVVQLLWCDNTVDCSIMDPVLQDVAGVNDGSATGLYSRGFAGGGNNRLKVMGGAIRHVDQGVDWTGSLGNINCVMVGTVAWECYTVGFKWANSSQQCLGSALQAIRCGWFGFFISGMTEVANPVVEHIHLDQCIARDTGALGTWPAKTDRSGFYVQYQPAVDTSYPRSVRITNSRAIDTQTTKTMHFGAWTHVVPPASYRATNELDNFESIGHLTAGVFGDWATDTVIVGGTGSATYPVATGTWTTIDWDVELYDPQGEHSTVSNSSNIVPGREGMYLVSATVTFDGNATGDRAIRFVVNGNVVPGALTRSRAATAANSTTLCLSVPLLLAPGGTSTVRVQAWQDSGAQRLVLIGESRFSAALMGLT